MILKIVFSHFRTRPFSNFLTLIAIAFCLGLLGGFWALSDNLRLLHATKGSQEGELSVFVDGSIASDKISSVETNLKNFKWVDTIQKVGTDESLKILKDKFGETLTANLSEKSLPITFRVKMQKSVNSKDLENDIETMKLWEGVIDVDLGGELWSGDIARSSTTTLMSWSNLLFGVVFVVVILLISHITRIGFEATRNDIETLTLLGASKRWIFAPLLIESVIMGVMGSILGLFMTVLFLKYGLPPLSEILFGKISAIQDLSWNALWKIVFMGTVASIIGAFLTWPLVASSNVRSA